MARKKKDKGMVGMIGGGLMLGAGVTALPKLNAPPSLSAAMVLPTRFAPLGAMAHMSKRIIKDIHKIRRRK